MKQNIIRERDTMGLIGRIFEDQQISDFHFDWNESKYFEFKVEYINTRSCHLLWASYGDMNILIRPLINHLLITVKEKVSF